MEKKEESKVFFGVQKSEEEVLMSIRRARISFLPEYGCALILIIAFIFLSSKAESSNLLKYLVLGLAALAIFSSEILRLIHLYEITSSKIIVTKGILVRHRKIVYLHPLAMNIPDINIRQSLWQRILNYGTISIEVTIEGNSIVLKDIAEPHKVMDFLEQLIETKRSSTIKKPN